MVYGLSEDQAERLDAKDFTENEYIIWNEQIQIQI